MQERQDNPKATEQIGPSAEEGKHVSGEEATQMAMFPPPPGPFGGASVQKLVNNSPRSQNQASIQRMARPYSPVETASSLGSESAKGAGGAGAQSGVVQRELDLSAVQGHDILERAINIFHELESEDLSQADFDILKTERQRFMPLMGRFGSAQGTTLRVAPNRSKKKTGDMAVTLLSGTTTDGAVLEYDDNMDAFHAAIANRQMASFRVDVLFWNRRVEGAEIPHSMKTVGTILQAFTHEMAVHAENMLDYIEDYWAYHGGSRDTPPTALGSASEEHQTFNDGEVKRYEYMSRLAKERPDISRDYTNRESNDHRTAK